MVVDVVSGVKIDREPRIRIIADLINEKFSLHLSQCSVELYDPGAYAAGVRTKPPFQLELRNF